MTTSKLAPKILFEDQHLMVVSKPAGLLSQGEHSGDPNLVDWLRKYLGRNYVGLIHRLDRNVSGVMLVAKRTKAARRLTDTLQQGEISRVYLGWVAGRLAQPKRWQHYLLKDPKTNRTRIVSGKRTESKEAVLSVQPVRNGCFEGRPVTLVEFRLETGRSHQIRVQSAKEGFPILGDAKYGLPSAAQKKKSRIALHSFKIRFPHPMSGEILEFEDALPADLCLTDH